MTAQQFDEKKSEAFGGCLMDMLNLGSLVLMTSIGHRTGLLIRRWACNPRPATKSLTLLRSMSDTCTSGSM